MTGDLATNGTERSKQVAPSVSADVVGQLTVAFRLESSVLCRSVMTAPWGFGIPGRDAGSFHVVIAGSAWLDVDGVADPIHLRAGDVAVLPSGDGHRVRDSPSSPAPLLATSSPGTTSSTASSVSVATRRR